MLTLPVQFTSLQAGYCFSTWQQAVADFSAVQYVTFPGNFTAINFGPTTPDPDDNDKPWWRTDANGNPRGKWTHTGGMWLAEHPLYNPKTDLVMRALMMIDIEEAAIPALDGGEAGTVTDTSGPMWELVAEYAARMPIAAGTLPSGTTLAVGNTGGEEKHVLTLEEIPEHRHGQPAASSVFADVTSGGTVSVNAPSGADHRVQPFVSDGGGLGHNNLPPYFCIRVLKKSLRKFWRLDP